MEPWEPWEPLAYAVGQRKHVPLHRKMHVIYSSWLFSLQVWFRQAKKNIPLQRNKRVWLLLTVPRFFPTVQVAPCKKRGPCNKAAFFLRVPTVFLVRVHFANIFPSFGLPKQKRPAQRTYMPLEQLLPQPLARLRHHFTAQALRSCAPSRHCQLHEGRWAPSRYVTCSWGFTLGEKSVPLQGSCTFFARINSFPRKRHRTVSLMSQWWVWANVKVADNMLYTYFDLCELHCLHFYLLSTLQDKSGIDTKKQDPILCSNWPAPLLPPYLCN